MHRLRGIRPILRRQRVAAPNGAAADHRGLPYAVDLVAEPARRSSWYMPSRNGAENVPSTGSGRPSVASPAQVKASVAARASFSFPAASVIGAAALRGLIQAAPSCAA